ncbi:MAG: hypothetical protein AcusKO_48590 [Acuticoccus sp.]
MTVAFVAATPLVLTLVYTVVNPPALPIVRRNLADAPVEHRWVPLEAIAPRLAQSVIMAEDARFCLHYGIDLTQLRIVINDALDGERPRGASTITMQVVKNIFLWPERNYLRKAIEVPLSVGLDLAMRKRRILEIYLNVAQFGPSQFGVEAGAQHFFGKSAADLSPDEALALATNLPAPSVRDPRRPSRRQRGVMAHVARELERAPWVFTCLPTALRP